jgi:outer membrane protein TolC
MIMRRSLAWLCAVGALLVAGVTEGRAPTPALDKATLAAVQKLQEERRKLLAEALAVREKLYQTGRAEMDGVLETSKRLLTTEVDLAATRGELIAVHERHLKTAQALIEIAKAKHESGRGTHASVLDAKDSVLEAQIGLLKAGGKLKKAEK